LNRLRGYSNSTLIQFGTIYFVDSVHRPTLRKDTNRGWSKSLCAPNDYRKNIRCTETFWTPCISAMLMGQNTSLSWCWKYGQNLS